MRNIGLMALLLSVVLVRGTAARQVEEWTYERLFKESDLVVIASAEATATTDDRVVGERWGKILIGQTTAFTVGTVVKGKATGGLLKVLHFKLADGVATNDGPRLARFRTKGAFVNGRGFDASLGKPQYLLFLKSVDGDRFAPVSGQIDPVLSVKEVYSPLPADIEDK